MDAPGAAHEMFVKAASHGAQLAFDAAPTAGEKKPGRHAQVHDDAPAEGAIWFAGQGAHERPEL
jgi:hypothetical protein